MSEQKLTGKIIAVLEERSGISQNGNSWRAREYVLETEGQYPRKCCFRVKGDRIEEFGIVPGDVLTVYLDIDAHDWQGKWYNEITAWKVERGETAE